MTQDELYIIEYFRNLLVWFLVFTFLWVLVEYLWEHRQEFKDNFTTHRFNLENLDRVHEGSLAMKDGKIVDLKKVDLS